MAIDTPEAIEFITTRLRPFAANLVELYYFAKRIVSEWDAAGLDKVILNDTTKVSDKAADAGGHSMIGSEANAIIVLCQSIITLVEAGKLPLISKAGKI